MYYQVVTTDRFGKVEGYTFDNAIGAIVTFAVEMANRGSTVEVLFHEVGSTVVTIADDELNFAEYVESPLGNGVRFYSHTTRKEMLSRLEDYKIPKGYKGRYYSKVILYDLKKQEVVQTLKQKA